MKKWLSVLLIVSGCALLFLNFLGLVLDGSVVEAGYRQSDGAIPGYSYQVRDTSLLRRMLDTPMSKFDVEDVNNIVFESVVHSDDRRIQIYENWLLWIVGKAYAPLGRTQDPYRIVAGKGGLCSEVAAVVNRIAEVNGHRARFVGLNGHVVSEVKTDDGWHVVDPDYGVTYPVDISVLERKEGARLIRSRLKDRGYSDETIEWYINLFQSAEDNTVTDVGVALSPRLYMAERVADYLKWLLPMVAIILGVWSIRKLARHDES